MTKKRKWISKAIKRPGALTRKAKAAGMSTMAFARAKKGAKGLTGQQARLAITLRGPKVAGKKRKARKARKRASRK